MSGSYGQSMKLEHNVNDADKPGAKWIVKEIKSMLHGFGDCSEPLYATAVLIEEVMMRQLRSAVYQAVDVAALRQSTHVQAEDFVFLMRKDTVKVKRLMKYLLVKDLRATEQGKLGGALDSAANSKLFDSSLNDSEPLKRCKNDFSSFLVANNDTLQLNDEVFDAEKHERLVRADKMSSSMDTAKYNEFCRARRISFTNSLSKMNALHDEVLGGMKDLPEAPKLTNPARDILCYFAFETVAQIVDLAFLVRQDAAAQISDPFSRYTVSSFVHPPATSSANGQIGAAPPISPSEVREAIRRYFTSRFNPFSSPLQQQKRLLAC